MGREGGWKLNKYVIKRKEEKNRDTELLLIFPTFYRNFRYILLSNLPSEGGKCLILNRFMYIITSHKH